MKKQRRTQIDDVFYGFICEAFIKSRLSTRKFSVSCGLREVHMSQLLNKTRGPCLATAVKIAKACGYDLNKLKKHAQSYDASKRGSK